MQSIATTLDVSFNMLWLSASFWAKPNLLRLLEEQEKHHAPAAILRQTQVNRCGCSSNPRRETLQKPLPRQGRRDICS